MRGEAQRGLLEGEWPRVEPLEWLWTSPSKASLGWTGKGKDITAWAKEQDTRLGWFLTHTSGPRFPWILCLMSIHVQSCGPASGLDSSIRQIEASLSHLFTLPWGVPRPLREAQPPPSAFTFSWSSESAPEDWRP